MGRYLTLLISNPKSCLRCIQSINCNKTIKNNVYVSLMKLRPKSRMFGIETIEESHKFAI